MFVVDERLAAGGMGEVYRGRNIATGDPVAIKVVLAELAKDETVVGLFFKEAKVLNTLHHPAIVRYGVFGIDPDVKRPYLVMEYVDGPSLAGMIDGRPMASGDARILLVQLASALDAAHRAGVIHRDISPDNVILPGGKVGAAKIIDFGIARATNVGAGTLLGGKFAGKYNFVSPEQLGLFGGEVTEVSDVYSLALVTANALRGAPVDMSGTPVEVIEKRRSVPDLSDIDPALRPLLELMLLPDPADRKVSMAAIADWLRAGADAAPDLARRVTTAVPCQTTIAPVSHAASASSANGGESTVLSALAGGRPSSRPPKEPTLVAPPQVARPKSDLGGAATPLARPEHDPLAYIRIEPGPAGPPPAAHAIKPEPRRRSRLPVYGLLALVTGAGGVALYALGYFGETEQQLAEGTGSGSFIETQPAMPPPPVAPPPAPTLSPAKPPTQVAEPETPAVTPAPPTVEPVKPEPSVVSPQRAPIRPPEQQTQAVTSDAPPALPPVATQPETSSAMPNASKVAPVPSSPVAPMPPVSGQPAADAPPLPMPEEAKPSLPTAQPKPKEEDVAIVHPPKEMTTPPAAPGEDQGIGTEAPKPNSPVDKRMAWLRAFNAGGCFFAHSVTSSPERMQIEGMAASAAPFEKLDAGFAKAFGFAPDVEGRLITNMQCGVATFLSALSRSKPPSISITLSSDQLKNGDALKGRVQDLTKERAVLYLIDNDGIVYPLDSLLGRDGHHGDFQVGRIEQSDDTPMPQLVLTLSSDKPIPGSLLSGPTENAPLFQELIQTITTERLDVDYGYAYFMLGGS
nr:protein kinase [Sinorhizobium fredii]